MSTEKEFQECFNNSEFAKMSDADIIKEIAKIFFEKGAESVKNSVLELLLMGDN